MWIWKNTGEKEIILLWKNWNYADVLAYVEMYSNKYWDFKEKVLPEVLKNCLIMAYSASLQAILGDMADIRLYL